MDKAVAGADGQTMVYGAGRFKCDEALKKINESDMTRFIFESWVGGVMTELSSVHDGIVDVGFGHPTEDEFLNGNDAMRGCSERDLFGRYYRYAQ